MFQIRKPFTDIFLCVIGVIKLEVIWRQLNQLAMLCIPEHLRASKNSHTGRIWKEAYNGARVYKSNELGSSWSCVALLVLLDYLQAPLDQASGAHYQPVLNFCFYHTHPQYLLGLALLTKEGDWLESH